MNTIPRRLLTTKEAAAFLNVSPKTLEKWRWNGEGPTFQKFGNKLVKYDPDVLAGWVSETTRSSTSEGR